MKLILRNLFFYILIIPGLASAQITTPVIKAGFGVDADLRANFFNNFYQSGNDDWYNNGTPGTGQFIIDTTGAAAIVANYLIDAAPWPYRMAPIYRTMRVPAFSLINNRLWMDALFVRDYHGTDTTVFAAGSNKNGDSPANWSCPVAQSIPDKNDILDMFVHIRRAGPTSADSLWMFGGISLDNVTGNRYFDFEMYQTDIYYDRATRKWYGYGPDMGHTSWQLDAAGNIIKAGDIIFTGQYQSSTLTNIEARIWVNQSTLSITPAQFNWSGQFDGAYAGAPYGYASIQPKTAGAFYTGLGSVNNTWAGPFQLILQDNTMAANYVKDQFMEFSVNLTKLGIDPATNLGGDICGTPFNRIVVKTRASSSFTAELKDFVAPLDLFLAPRALVAANIPDQCGELGVSDIFVTNPSPTSTYTWSTPDGHIVGPTSGTTIQVDSVGTYIVTQRLQAGCSPYATDTMVVTLDTSCSVLPNTLLDFRGNLYRQSASLSWKVSESSYIDYFDVQRSTDNTNFEDIGRVESNPPDHEYSLSENVSSILASNIYYRLKLQGINGSTTYSNVIRMALPKNGVAGLFITPNPVKDIAHVTIQANESETVILRIYDQSGKLLKEQKEFIQPGTNAFSINDFDKWQTGVYNVNVTINGTLLNEKIVVVK